MKSKINNNTIFLLLILIILTWCATYLIYLYIPDWASRGQFGDMFGSVNALFSGLALFGIIIAIFLQKQDLELQRKELALTREELKRTAEAQERSQQAFSEQSEALFLTAKLNSLNSLISAYNDILSRQNKKTPRDNKPFIKFAEKRNQAIKKTEDILSYIENISK